MRATCCLLALSVAVLLLAAYVSAAPTGYCDDSTVYCGSANYRTGNCTCNFDCNCLSGRDHTEVYPGTCRVSSVAVCSDPGPISATETGLGSTAVLGFNPVPGSLTLTKGGKNVALKVRGEAVRGRSGFDINWVSNLLSPDRTACATHGMEPYLCGTTQSVAQGCSALTDSTTCESKLGCQWSQSVCSSSYTYQHATVSNTSQVAFSCETGSNANYAIESTLNTAQRVIRIQQSQVGSPRPLGHHFVCTGNPGTNNRLYCPTATSCPLSMKSGARPSVEPERWNWVCPENPTCPPPSLPGYSNPWTVDTHQSFNFYQCPPGGITLNPAVYQPASGDPCSQTIACGQAVTSPTVAADDCPIGWWCQAAGFETPKCPPQGPTWTQITKKRDARAVGDYYCPAGARITIDNLQYYVDLNQATESDGTYACRGDTDGEFRCPDGQTGCPQWRKADGTIVQITCDLSSYPLSNGPNLCPPRSVTYQAHEDKPTQGMPETVVIRLNNAADAPQDTPYAFAFGPSGVVTSSSNLCDTACDGTCAFTTHNSLWLAKTDMTWVTDDPGSSGHYLALFDVATSSPTGLVNAPKRLAVIMNADQAITAVYEETGTWATTTLAEFTDTTKGVKRCTGGALYLSGRQRVFRFEGCKTSTGYTCGNPIELRSVNPDFLAGSYAWDSDDDDNTDPVGCARACGALINADASADALGFTVSTASPNTFPAVPSGSATAATKSRTDAPYFGVSAATTATDLFTGQTLDEAIVSVDVLLDGNRANAFLHIDVVVTETPTASNTVSLDLSSSSSGAWTLDSTCYGATGTDALGFSSSSDLDEQWVTITVSVNVATANSRECVFTVEGSRTDGGTAISATRTLTDTPTIAAAQIASMTIQAETVTAGTAVASGTPISGASSSSEFLLDDIVAGDVGGCETTMGEENLICTGSVDASGTAIVYACNAPGQGTSALTFTHDYGTGNLVTGAAGSSMCLLDAASDVGDGDLNKVTLSANSCVDVSNDACTGTPLYLSPVVSTVVRRAGERGKVRATEKLVRVTPVHHSRKVTDPTVYTCGNAPTGSVFGVPADLANPATAASARLYFPPTVPETREYYEAPASSLTSVPEDFYPCNQGPVYCFGFQPDGWHTEEYTPAPTAAGSAPLPEAWCPPMSVHRTAGTAGTPAEAFVNSPEGWSDGDSTCWDELSIDVPWNQAVAKDCCRRTEEACVNQGATVTCARYDCTPEVCAIDQLPEAWGPPASFTRTRSVCQDLPISILYTITFVDASVTFTANIRGNSECFVVRMFYDDVDRRFVVVTECRVDNPFRLDEPFTQVNDGQTPLGVLKLPQSVPQGSPNEVSPAGTYHFGHTNTFGNTLPTVPGQTSYNFATSNCPTTLDATPEEKCIHTTTIFFDSPPGGWGVYCTTGFASDPANPPQAPWLITWGGDYLCKDTLLPPSVQRPCGGISVPPAPAQFEVEVNNVDFCAEVFQVQFTVDITLHDPVSDLQLQGDLTTGEDYIARVKIVPIAGQEDATTFLATSNITKVVLQGDIVNGDPGYELTLHDVNAITPPQPPVSTAIRWFRTRVTEEDTSGGVRRSVLYLEYQFNVSPGVFFLVNSQPGPGILYRFLVSGDVHHLGSQPQKRITPVRAISNSRQGTNVDPFFEEAEFTIPDGTTGGPPGPTDNGSSSSSGLSGLEIGLIAAGVGVVAIGAAVLVVAAMLRKKNMASQWTKSSVMI